MKKTDRQEKISEIKHVIFQAFASERAGEISKLGLVGTFDLCISELITLGRVSVLEDFDAVCSADAFMGFTEQEFNAIKKFFAFNKEITNWDK